MDGLETSLFGRSEAKLWEAKVLQVLDGLAHGTQLPLEGDRKCTEHRATARRGPYAAERVLQKAAALLRAVGAPERRDESERFLVLQRVGLDGLQQGLLVLGRECAQCVGQRKRHGTGIDLRRHFGIEAIRQKESCRNPALLA